MTDKGVPAAIFMAQTHALLRAASGAGLTPAQVLLRVNAFLMEMNDKGLFATVIYGLLDQSSGSFDYARAGHEYPFLIDPQGRAASVESGVGMPVGILDEPALDENSLHILPGGLLLLFSDGVTDCTDPAGERFGLERLESTLHKLADYAPAQQVCQAIFDELMSFQGAAPQFDDITMLAVRRD